jgi:hypothetical protein
MVTRTGWNIRKTLWNAIESGASWKELEEYTTPLYRAKLISSVEEQYTLEKLGRHRTPYAA